MIVILAAYFASSNPDGLNFVAQKYGFAAKGLTRVPLLSGPFAGIAGILIILVLSGLMIFVIKRGGDK